MKALKYFLILGLLATGFVSCKEDDDDTEQIKNLDDIPKGKAKLNLDGVYLLFPAVEYEPCDFKVFKDTVAGESCGFNYELGYSCHSKSNDSLAVSIRRSEIEISSEQLKGIIDEEILIYMYPKNGCDTLLGRTNVTLKNGYDAEKVSYRRVVKEGDNKLEFLFEVYYVINDIDGRLYNVRVSMPYGTRVRHYDYLTDIVGTLKFGK
jgi:hypothetical protein